MFQWNQDLNISKNSCHILNGQCKTHHIRAKQCNIKFSNGHPSLCQMFKFVLTCSSVSSEVVVEVLPVAPPVACSGSLRRRSTSSTAAVSPSIAVSPLVPAASTSPLAVAALESPADVRLDACPCQMISFISTITVEQLAECCTFVW